MSTDQAQQKTRPSEGLRAPFPKKSRPERHDGMRGSSPERPKNHAHVLQPPAAGGSCRKSLSHRQAVATATMPARRMTRTLVVILLRLPPQPDGRASSLPARSSVRVSCVNVRDALGLWRLIKVLECNFYFTDIICIKESCVFANEFSTVANKFFNLGFKARWAEGSPGNKATGGCITVVRPSIPPRFIEVSRVAHTRTYL